VDTPTKSLLLSRSIEKSQSTHKHIITDLKNTIFLCFSSTSVSDKLALDGDSCLNSEAWEVAFKSHRMECGANSCVKGDWK